MTIIPETHVTLSARTDADFEQLFEVFTDKTMTTPRDLTGWAFRFAVKKDVLDASDWLAVESGAISVVAEAGQVSVSIERAALLAAMPAGAKRQDGEWALQGVGPNDLDAVWAAGRFTLLRGL